jgi:hypothetical protein
MVNRPDVWDLLNIRRLKRSRPTEAVSPDDVWERLQQPRCPTEAEPGYRLLRAALDVGWRIEEPVYLRPRWNDGGPRVYHFILRHTAVPAQRLLSVPDSPEVGRFVRDEGLRVSVKT